MIGLPDSVSLPEIMKLFEPLAFKIGSISFSDSSVSKENDLFTACCLLSLVEDLTIGSLKRLVKSVGKYRSTNS